MSLTQTTTAQTATLRTCATCANWQPAEGRLFCRIYGAQLCNHDACTAYFRYAPQAEAARPDEGNGTEAAQEKEAKV